MFNPKDKEVFLLLNDVLYFGIDYEPKDCIVKSLDDESFSANEYPYVIHAFTEHEQIEICRSNDPYGCVKWVMETQEMMNKTFDLYVSNVVEYMFQGDLEDELQEGRLE